MKKAKKIRLLVIVLVLLVIIAAAAGLFSKKAGGEERAEARASIEETVSRLALQCYLIEGAYPQGLEYLEENYGLIVNQEDYLILYTPLAENLPPSVRVLDREE